MTTEAERYPLSTQDGEAIPLEVIRPRSFLRKSFTSEEASAVLTIPDGVNLMVVSTDADCFIRFGTTASIPADGVLISDTLLLAREMQICVSPIADTFTIIGDTEAGTLNVQFIETWAGLSLETKTRRL